MVLKDILDDEYYLCIDEVKEKKELFNVFIEKWEKFFSNPKLFEKIDRKIIKEINAYEWQANTEAGKMLKCNSPLYSCKYADGEFRYSYYDNKNLYFEFTKDGITLSFIITPVEKDGLELFFGAYFIEEAEELKIFYSKRPSSSNPYNLSFVNYNLIFEKMGLDDLCKKISAFIEHSENSNTFSEDIKQSEKDEEERIKREKLRKRYEEEKKQQAIDEEIRINEERMNRLRNL